MSGSVRCTRHLCKSLVYFTLDGMKKIRDESAALRLAVALKRLRARMREAAPSSSAGLPISQISILNHLRKQGASTASSLAVAEHLSQQAIAQHLASLKRAGLVQTAPDPGDGRKILVSISDAGNEVFETILDSRNSWLAGAIDSVIAPEERPALDQAIALLERLAGAKGSG